jgi:hypothetical protein
VSALEKQLELAHRANEQEQKRVDDLIRERDILTKLKTQAENSSGRQLDLIKINEGTQRNLEQEIRGFRIEAQKQQHLLFQLDKEREKYGQEATESTAKYLQVRFQVHQYLLRLLVCFQHWRIHSWNLACTLPPLWTSFTSSNTTRALLLMSK